MSDSPIDLPEWERKLVGKVIVESSSSVKDSSTEFAEQDVRAGVPLHRILKPGSIITLDYREDRLNVYVDNTMRCQKVTIG